MDASNIPSWGWAVATVGSVISPRSLGELPVNLALLLIHKSEICLPSLKHVTISKAARKS